MKKTILLAISLMISVVSFAQQQLATLNHNDSITVYYGMDALVSAHNAAVNGDIITLSSGVFNSVNITKAVTIRGAGAWTDSLGNPTTTYNSFTINVPNDSIYHLTLEGIYTFSNVTIQKAYNPQFIKCWFDNYVNCGADDQMMRNCMFVNCEIRKWNHYSNSQAQFINSVILESINYTNSDVFINCVLKQSSYSGHMQYRLFQNCVLYDDHNYNDCPTDNSANAQNCIFINTSTVGCGDLFAGSPNHVLWNMRGWDTVFKTTGYFELTDSIAATCLGGDGTQVGIYGGMMPFNPRVTNPVIKSINVGQRSTADGKLAVDIEVVSEGE